MNRRKPTERPFVLDRNWQDIAGHRKQSEGSEKKVTRGSQKTANRDVRQKTGTASAVTVSTEASQHTGQLAGTKSSTLTTPDSNHLSRQLSVSQSTRTQVDLSSSPSRKNVAKPATSKKISSPSGASNHNSAVGLASSRSVEGMSHSTRSKHSVAGSNSRTPESTLVTGTSRENANKQAVSNEKSGPGSSGYHNSAVSTVSSRSAERTEARSSGSNAHFRKPEISSVIGAGRKDADKDTATVRNSRSKSHDLRHHNSAVNISSFGSSERDKHLAKSQPGTLTITRNSRELRSHSSVAIPSNASSTSSRVRTAERGRESLQHGPTESGSSLARRGKNSADRKVAYSTGDKAKGVNLGGSGVVGHNEDRSIRLTPAEEGVARYRTRNVSGVNRLTSSAAVTHRSVLSTPQNVMTPGQISDHSDTVFTAAGLDAVTSGKTSVMNLSNTATSTRTRRVVQSKQTAASTGTSAASEAVVSDAASLDAISSGKTSRNQNADSIRAGPTRIQAVENVACTQSAPAAVSSATALVSGQTAGPMESVVTTARRDVVTPGMRSAEKSLETASSGTASVADSMQTDGAGQTESPAAAAAASIRPTVR